MPGVLIQIFLLWASCTCTQAALAPARYAKPKPAICSWSPTLHEQTLVFSEDRALKAGQVIEFDMVDPRAFKQLMDVSKTTLEIMFGVTQSLERLAFGQKQIARALMAQSSLSAARDSYLFETVDFLKSVTPELQAIPDTSEQKTFFMKLENAPLGWTPRQCSLKPTSFADPEPAGKYSDFSTTDVLRVEFRRRCLGVGYRGLSVCKENLAVLKAYRRSLCFSSFSETESEKLAWDPSRTDRSGFSEALPFGSNHIYEVLHSAIGFELPYDWRVLQTFFSLEDFQSVYGDNQLFTVGVGPEHSSIVFRTGQSCEQQVCGGSVRRARNVEILPFEISLAPVPDRSLQASDLLAVSVAKNEGGILLSTVRAADKVHCLVWELVTASHVVANGSALTLPGLPRLMASAEDRGIWIAEATRDSTLFALRLPDHPCQSAGFPVLECPVLLTSELAEDPCADLSCNASHCVLPSSEFQACELDLETCETGPGTREVTKAFLWNGVLCLTGGSGSSASRSNGTSDRMTDLEKAAAQIRDELEEAIRRADSVGKDVESMRETIRAQEEELNALKFITHVRFEIYDSTLSSLADAVGAVWDPIKGVFSKAADLMGSITSSLFGSFGALGELLAFFWKYGFSLLLLVIMLYGLTKVRRVIPKGLCKTRERTARSFRIRKRDSTFHDEVAMAYAMLCRYKSRHTMSFMNDLSNLRAKVGRTIVFRPLASGQWLNLPRAAELLNKTDATDYHEKLLVLMEHVKYNCLTWVARDDELGCWMPDAEVRTDFEAIEMARASSFWELSEEPQSLDTVRLKEGLHDDGFEPPEELDEVWKHVRLCLRDEDTRHPGSQVRFPTSPWTAPYLLWALITNKNIKLVDAREDPVETSLMGNPLLLESEGTGDIGTDISWEDGESKL